jgi:hypothetical protein
MHDWREADLVHHEQVNKMARAGAIGVFIILGNASLAIYAMTKGEWLIVTWLVLLMSTVPALMRRL